MGIAAAIIVIVAWLLPKSPQDWAALALIALIGGPYLAYQAWPTGTLIVGGILLALFVAAFWVEWRKRRAGGI